MPTCVVDQYTYRTSDPVYGPTGLEILRADHVVLVIPERPLTNTRYTATIRQPGAPPSRGRSAARAASGVPERP